MECSLRPARRRPRRRTNPSKAGASVVSGSGAVPNRVDAWRQDPPTRAIQSQPARPKLRAYIDGSCLTKPHLGIGTGPAGAGVYIEADGVRPAEEIYVPLGIATCNVAEWRALLVALARAEELGADRLDVLCDSLLVVGGVRRMARGRGYGGASGHLRPLAEEARARISRLRGFSITKIPREENRRADRLAKRASAESRLVGLREARGFRLSVPRRHSTTRSRTERG